MSGFKLKLLNVNFMHQKFLTSALKIDAAGLHPNEGKVKAIVEAPEPTLKQFVQAPEPTLKQLWKLLSLL